MSTISFARILEVPGAILDGENFIPHAFADQLVARVGQTIYVPGDDLQIYGKGDHSDVLLVTLYDPSGRPVKLDTVPIDKNGIFKQVIFKWPEPSKNLAFGNYNIQIASSTSPEEKEEISIIYTDSLQSGGETLPGTSIQPHVLQVKLDSPDEVTIGKSFRIFIQVTFDGALVTTDDARFLLGSSHIHSSRSASDTNATLNLSDKFYELHDGLYYADVTLDTEDSYIIHAIAFYRGFLSHDSKVITATTSSIGSVQESVNALSNKLNSTKNELDILEKGLAETQYTLNDTRNSISGSLDEARDSIKTDIGKAFDTLAQMESASGQINSIILPVLALISIIIALQISLFARIRASYK